jgi:hypothetical protein
MTEIICERKYCEYNEMGECTAKKIYIKERLVKERGDWYITDRLSVCQTCEILGSEA